MRPDYSELFVISNITYINFRFMNINRKKQIMAVLREYTDWATFNNDDALQ